VESPLGRLMGYLSFRIQGWNNLIFEDVWSGNLDYSSIAGHEDGTFNPASQLHSLGEITGLAFQRGGLRPANRWAEGRHGLPR
jgi:hypothetical protein